MWMYIWGEHKACRPLCLTLMSSREHPLQKRLKNHHHHHSRHIPSTLASLLGHPRICQVSPKMLTMVAWMKVLCGLNYIGLKGVNPPVKFGERTRDCQQGWLNACISSLGEWCRALDMASLSRETCHLPDGWLTTLDILYLGGGSDFFLLKWMIW